MKPKEKNKEDRYYCTRAFDHIQVLWDGEVTPCCYSWVNGYTIGNINQNSYEELWDGEKAQEFRKSILDGSFKYCDRKSCPHLQQKNKTVVKLRDVRNKEIKEDIEQGKTILSHGPHEIQFCYDRSCNLACPSCRVSVIIESGKRKDELLDLQEKLKLEYFKDARSFVVTGSGDAFGSPIFRRLLQNLKEEDCPSLETLGILTNGLLAKRYWHTLSDLALKRLKWINVSIDAACEETYKINRFPGDWNTLKENLNFIREKREDDSLAFHSFSISSVVQQNNYKEMIAFVEMGIAYGCDRIEFQIIEPDYFDGNGRMEEWRSKAVAEISHPEHNKLIKVLVDPDWLQLENKINITFGPLHDIREKEMKRKIK